MSGILLSENIILTSEKKPNIHMWYKTHVEITMLYTQRKDGYLQIVCIDGSNTEWCISENFPFLEVDKLISTLSFQTNEDTWNFDCVICNETITIKNVRGLSFLAVIEHLKDKHDDIIIYWITQGWLRKVTPED